MTVRGNRLIVPYQPHILGVRDGGGGGLTAAQRPGAHRRRRGCAPIRMEDLAAKLQAELPAAAPTMVTAMLTELVARPALITSLHAPSTVPDALGHLLE